MSTVPKPNIVLVHGAFANASGWGRVISILESDGYHVSAVENPLSSLEADVATTKRVVDAQTGPTVLVGHSYGGSVISGAAVGAPNVKALVYVAAFIPEAGESLGQLTERFTPPALIPALVPDSAGFLFIDREKFHSVFCADLPEAEARIMAASQKPLHNSAFAVTHSAVAWHDLPSYYIQASDDLAINPELERFMAERAGAKLTEIQASHVVFLTHPEAVAKVIAEAAEAAAE